MCGVRVPAIVLAAAMTIGPLIYGQTAPDITLPPGDAVRGKAVFESSKANCLSCHRVNEAGSLFGPNLSTIAAPPRGGGGGAARGGGVAARGGGGTAAAPAAAAGGARAGTPVPAGAIPPPPGGTAPGGRGAQGGGNPPAGPTQQQLAQSILDPNAVVSLQNRYVLLKMKDGKTISGKLLSVDTFAYQIFDSTERLANISKDNVREMTMASPMPSYRDKLTTQELSDVISYLMSLKGQ